MSDEQFGRRASLTVAAGATGLDLSDLHFRFQISASDSESPNAAVIRVYNLSSDTMRQIQGEFTRVVVQAGYENASFGVIFDGTIKQFRIGKENATDRYLDILAAENDLEYNFGVCNATLAAGSTAKDRITAAAAGLGLKVGVLDASLDFTGGTLPRGKVLWGMGKLAMRCAATSIGATWTMQDGKINVTSLKGYLPGEAVVLNAGTGVVGIPEQTDQGIKVRALLNPRIKIGGLVQIDNASINQMLQADLRADGTFTERNLPAGQIVYNSRAGLTFPASVAADGLYRVLVIEYTGDTRGQDWYCDLICLAVDPSSKTVQAVL